MTTAQQFEDVLGAMVLGKVVDFDAAADLLLPMDFSASNVALVPELLDDNVRFSAWVAGQLAANHCRYGIGGYNEHRSIYSRSQHFDDAGEPRRLHLGVDIWGPAGTVVYNFHDAQVHSFRFNDGFGDYGATVILKYEVDGLTFHVLYGHLSLDSLKGLEVGMTLPAGSAFASFGIAEENGHWPPHLHFQVILNMQGLKGDYPGVCQFSKRQIYLLNCPDPAVILRGTFGEAIA